MQVCWYNGQVIKLSVRTRLCVAVFCCALLGWAKLTCLPSSTQSLLCSVQWPWVWVSVSMCHILSKILSHFGQTGQASPHHYQLDCNLCWGETRGSLSTQSYCRWKHKFLWSPSVNPCILHELIAAFVQSLSCVLLFATPRTVAR